MRTILVEPRLLHALKPQRPRALDTRTSLESSSSEGQHTICIQCPALGLPVTAETLGAGDVADFALAHSRPINKNRLIIPRASG